MVVIYTDGTPKGYICIYDVEENRPRFARIDYKGKLTNNIAEYFAVIGALEHAKRKGYHEVTIRSDSELVVKQMKGEYKIKNHDLIHLATQVVALSVKYEIKLDFEHVPRERNYAGIQLDDYVDRVEAFL